jgi:hypothetical protein
MKTSSSAASATAISLGPFARLQQMRIRLLPQGLVSGCGNQHFPVSRFRELFRNKTALVNLYFQCRFSILKRLTGGRGEWWASFKSAALAVRRQPVYKPPAATSDPTMPRLRRALQSWSADALAKAGK